MSFFHSYAFNRAKKQRPLDARIPPKAANGLISTTLSKAITKNAVEKIRDNRDSAKKILIPAGKTTADCVLVLLKSSMTFGSMFISAVGVSTAHVLAPKRGC